MSKKTIYHIIEWVIALAACAYLIWKIATYEDYAALGESLRAMSWPQWLAIGVCVALMPVNMALEAWRWMTLMNGANGANGDASLNGEMMSWREAQQQVYYSKLAGLITPWRLGEYPARAVLMSSQPSTVRNQTSLWARVLSMGAVGSATMTTVIIIAGIVAMMMIADWRLEIGDWRYSYLLGVAIMLAFLALALWFAPQLLRRWAVVSRQLVAVSLGQSFARLLCWCVQLGLVLWALGGGEISLLRDHVITNTFIYYLLVTVTPNVPIAEVGVRGTWAIVVFGTMNAALAGVLLWVINTLLPCLIWPFLRKNIK